MDWNGKNAFGVHTNTSETEICMAKHGQKYVGSSNDSTPANLHAWINIWIFISYFFCLKKDVAEILWPKSFARCNITADDESFALAHFVGDVLLLMWLDYSVKYAFTAHVGQFFVPESVHDRLYFAFSLLAFDQFFLEVFISMRFVVLSACCLTAYTFYFFTHNNYSQTHAPQW